MNAKMFIDNLKKYYDKKGKGYKVPKQLVELFITQILTQLECFEGINIAHGDIKGLFLDLDL